MFTSLGLGERPAGRKGAVRRGIPCRAQTLARRVRQACRVAEDDECPRASAIVLCTESVGQPSLRLFVVRFAKDLLGPRGDGVHDTPISVRMSTSLITVTWDSILRHAGRQESVAHDTVIPFLGYQLPMPAKERVRRESAADLVQHLSSQDFRLHSQSSSLVIVEKDPLPAEPLLENFDFCPLELDDLLLQLVHPAGENHQ